MKRKLKWGHARKPQNKLQKCEAPLLRKRRSRVGAVLIYTHRLVSKRHPKISKHIIKMMLKMIPKPAVNPLQLYPKKGCGKTLNNQHRYEQVPDVGSHSEAVA